MAGHRHPIIDTHVHFWDFKDERLKWVWLERDWIHPILGNIDAMKAVAYQIDDVWAEARFADVEGFVHVQAAIGSADPVDETRWLHEMRQRSAIPFTIIADATLGADNAAAVIDGHAESPYFVGVRDFTAEPMLAAGGINAAYEQSLRILAERSLVFDLDCEWPNMAAARALAERHPDLLIVLEHIGFPRARDDDYFENWRSGMRTLAGAPNVTCKISGVGMTDPRFTPESLRRWVETCVEVFGPARCVLGSNWPVDRLYSSYDVIMDLYRGYIAGLGETEQVAILSGNARRLYRL